MCTLLCEWMLIYCACIVCVHLQAALHRHRVPDAETEGRGLLWTAARPHRQTQVEGKTGTHTHTHTHTEFTVRTGSFSHWKLCIIKWNTLQLDVDPIANPNPNRPTPPNAYGMFNLLIANQ